VTDHAGFAAFAHADLYVETDPFGSDESESADCHADIRPQPPALDARQRRRLIELIELHRPALLKFVKRILISAEDAEDVVQETCIRMMRVRDLWRSEREARAVLYTIATNLARDEIRRRKTRCHGHHQSFDTVELVAEQEQPEDWVDRTIARGIIAQALVKLPTRYREVFSLHVEEHMSYRAIARQLGVSTKTVERDLSGVHELCLDRFGMRRAACA
jgi:RNA polymerase sigma factor (sigma-70 family)